MIRKKHEAGPPAEAQPQSFGEHFSPFPRISALWLTGALVLLATACHILYSHLGFNPTDDGLQLAFARRILNGEVPHRDFISVRPALSYYVWAPALALFGDNVLLLSRLVVWLQWAGMTAIWTWLFVRALPSKSFAPAEVIAAGGIAFVTSVHIFPVMPWHTTDGLALASLGLLLSSSLALKRWRALGWFPIGLAPLCKQSFAPAAVLLLLLSPDRKRWQAWAVAALPALLYACGLIMAGAGNDAWEQLTSNRNFFAAALFSFPAAYPPFFGVMALATAWVLMRDRLERTALYSPLSILAAVSFGVLPPIGFHLLPAPLLASIHLFAVLLGFAVGLSARQLFSHFALPEPLTPTSPEQRTFVWQAVILGWGTAISVAVNYPALAGGLLWLAAFAVFYSDWQKLVKQPTRRFAVVMIAAIVMALEFHYFRTHRIYREAPASRLTHNLDDALRGGKGIRTNKELVSMLSNLSNLARRCSDRQRPYAILPDCSAWWICVADRNPLPVVWDNEVELSSEKLLQRAISVLESQRGQLTVFVTRYETDSLAKERQPLLPRYPLTQYIRFHWRKTGETTYFEIFE